MINLKLTKTKLIAKIFADNQRIFKAKVKAQKEELKNMPIEQFYILLTAFAELGKELNLFRRIK